MEIPSSRIINQYIACQGPLPHTCTDFWQMTWEQGSSMVVMLTTQVERGRVRSSSYGCYQVTCHSEEGNTAYVFRKMTLFNQEVWKRGGLLVRAVMFKVKALKDENVFNLES
ncbi:PTPN4 [Cervus elaphus hippelaphus]|uniref:PTPN4 n=1 Tax=Cervus elaphus hippelaphus TaxID=46360 RepID=A0A212C1G4_CEREH|nr:PTPN4 [Cervus elaphus hippelaphus]